MVRLGREQTEEPACYIYFLSCRVLARNNNDFKLETKSPDHCWSQSPDQQDYTSA